MEVSIRAWVRRSLGTEYVNKIRTLFLLPKFATANVSHTTDGRLTPTATSHGR